MPHLAPGKKAALVAACLIGGISAPPDVWISGEGIATHAGEVEGAARSGNADPPTPAGQRQAVEKLFDWLTPPTTDSAATPYTGVEVLVEIQTGAALADYLRPLRHDTSDAMRKAGIESCFRFEGGHAIVEIADSARMAEAGTILAGLVQSFDGTRAADQEVLHVAQVEGAFVLTLSDAGQSALDAQVMAESLDVLRQRIDAAGPEEPVLRRQGAHRILIRAPGFDSKQPLVDLFDRTGRLSFHDVIAPDPATAASDLEQPCSDRILRHDGQGQSYLLARTPILTGAHLSDAGSSFAPANGQPSVTFHLDDTGTQILNNWSAANIGRQLAIVVDDIVVTAPIVRSAIPHGAVQITGDFTVASAAEMAVLLRSGALPAPIRVIESHNANQDPGSQQAPAR